MHRDNLSAFDNTIGKECISTKDMRQKNETNKKSV